MTNTRISQENHTIRVPNGAGIAAILATGIGAFALAVLAIIADHSPSFRKLMLFYTPTGPLSGVTTTAIVVWLVCWICLHAAWKRLDIRGRVAAVGLGLIAISFILMFPPVGDLF